MGQKQWCVVQYKHCAAGPSFAVCKHDVLFVCQYKHCAAGPSMPKELD